MLIIEIILLHYFSFNQAKLSRYIHVFSKVLEVATATRCLLFLVASKASAVQSKQRNVVRGGREVFVVFSPLHSSPAYPDPHLGW